MYLRSFCFLILALCAKLRELTVALYLQNCVRLFIHLPTGKQKCNNIFCAYGVFLRLRSAGRALHPRASSKILHMLQGFCFHDSILTVYHHSVHRCMIDMIG